MDSFLDKSVAIPIRGIPFILRAMIDRCYALFFVTYANYTIFLMAKQIDFRTFIECRPSGDGLIPTSSGIFSCLNCDLGIFGITETRFSSESRIVADDADCADFGINQILRQNGREKLNLRDDFPPQLTVLKRQSALDKPRCQLVQDN